MKRVELNDLTGQRFGRLEALERVGTYVAPKGNTTIPIWLCRCDCGKYIEVLRCNLTTKKTKSCGCIRKEQAKKAGKARRENDVKKCVFNIGVDCNEVNCRKCGWNPKEDERRKKKLRGETEQEGKRK